jgi:hypothetical protein
VDLIGLELANHEVDIPELELVAGMKRRRFPTDGGAVGRSKIFYLERIAGQA